MNSPPSRRKKAASIDSTNEDISQQEDPGSATITVTAVEVTELTEQEIRDRLLLERKVERAFFEAGKALISKPKSFSKRAIATHTAGITNK